MCDAGGRKRRGRLRVALPTVPRLSSRAAAGCLLVVWLGYFTALQWSVVRYRLAIVVVLTSAAVLLGTALLRGWRLERLPRRLLAGAGVVAAVVAEVVPFFSHTTPGERRLLAHLVAATAALAALVLLAAGRRAAPAAFAVATLGTVVWTVTAIRLSPTPRIDVWVTLQQAADGLVHGQNMYAMTWTGSPGIQDAFTYLPWTGVLLAPGRWLAGDVRWALLAWTLVGVVGLLQGHPDVDPGRRVADHRRDGTHQVRRDGDPEGDRSGPGAGPGEQGRAGQGAGRDGGHGRRPRRVGQVAEHRHGDGDDRREQEGEGGRPRGQRGRRRAGPLPPRQRERAGGQHQHDRHPKADDAPLQDPEVGDPGQGDGSRKRSGPGAGRHA